MERSVKTVKRKKFNMQRSDRTVKRENGRSAGTALSIIIVKGGK